MFMKLHSSGRREHQVHVDLNSASYTITHLGTKQMKKSQLLLQISLKS